MGGRDWFAEKHRDWRLYLKKTHFLSRGDREEKELRGVLVGVFSFSWLSNWPCLVAVSSLCRARKKRKVPSTCKGPLNDQTSMILIITAAGLIMVV